MQNDPTMRRRAGYAVATVAVFFAMFLIGASVAHAAPAHVSTNSTDNDSDPRSATSNTYVTSGSDVVLLISVVWGAESNVTLPAANVTYDSQALVSVNKQCYSASNRCMEVFKRKLLPAEIGSKTYQVTWSGGSVDYSNVTLSSYSGADDVDLGTDVGTTGLGTGPTVDITPGAATSMLAAFVDGSGGDTDPFDPGTLTERADGATGTGTDDYGGVGPAITANTMDNDASSANSATTASISPSANQLILLGIVARDSSQIPPLPTVSGNGLTWDLVERNDFDQTGTRTSSFVYRAMSSSTPSMGEITINFGGTVTGIMWNVTEFDNAVTGANGANAIVQAVAGPTGSSSPATVTLLAFADANNATYGIAGVGSGYTFTFAGPGFTALGASLGAGSGAMRAEWRNDNDTTVDMIYSGTNSNGMIGIEIAAAPAVTNADDGYWMGERVATAAMTPHTMNATMSASDDWAIIAVEVTEAAAGGGGGFPTVVARLTSTEGSAATSHGVDLPAGSTGDLLLAFFAVDDPNSDVTVTWPGCPGSCEWTEIKEINNTISDGNQLNIAYRQADGTEGSSITVITDLSERSAHVVLRISGHEDPAVQPPEVSTGATASSSAADPDSLTPTGGAKDYLWIAAGNANDSGNNVTGAPTGYTNLQDRDTGGSGSCEMYTAERTLNAASENPGVFTATGSQEWAAVTVAVHPAPAVPAQYFTDFSEYSAGAGAPADWTVFGADDWAVVADGGATGGQFLELDNVSSEDRVLYWNDPPNATNSLEIVSRMRWSGGGTNGKHYLFFGETTTSGFDEFKVHYQNASEIRLRSGSTVLDTQSIVIAADTWYWMRLQRDGTNLRAKVWLDSASEPGSWQIDVINNTDFDPVRTAIGGWNGSTTLDFDVVGVGVNGATAPTSSGGGPVTVNRVRDATDDGAPATATFGATPTQGNLLVAISMHRVYTGNPGISGTGWTLALERCDSVSGEPCNNPSSSWRRGIAVWYKIAGASEPVAITTDWNSGTITNRLVIQEFEIVGGGTFTFDKQTSNDSNRTFVSSQTTGTTGESAQANSLLVTAMGTRDTTGAFTSWTNGVGNNLPNTGNRTVHTGFGVHSTQGTKESTASWTNSVASIGGILVFSVVGANTAPTITGTGCVGSTAFSDSPDPVDEGSNVDFCVDWNDVDAGDTDVEIYVCKTTGITPGTGCDGGGSDTWVSVTGETTDPADESDGLFYTTTGSDVGVQNYEIYVCDDEPTCSAPSSGTFTVNASNTAPTITGTGCSGAAYSDSPDPQNELLATTFCIGWNDADVGDQVKVHACKSNLVTPSTTGGSCDGGSWASSSALTSTDPKSETYTTQTGDIGPPANNYWVFVCDDDSSDPLCSGTGGNSGTFDVNDTPVHDVPVIDDGDNVLEGNNVIFTVDWTDTDDSTTAITIYVCDTTGITPGTGCDGTTYASKNNPLDPTGSADLVYLTTEADSGAGPISYNAYICDNNSPTPLCSAASPGVFTVDEQTLNIDFLANDASSLSGPDPLNVTLEGFVLASGTAVGTINYSFWWDCTDSGTDVGTVEGVCGSLPVPPGCNTFGCKYDGVGPSSGAHSQTTGSHTYDTSGSPYTAKVIIERGMKDPPVTATVPITVSATPPPTVTTNDATVTGQTTATISGEANPNGFQTNGWFRYEAGTGLVCNDADGIRIPGAGADDLLDGTSSVQIDDPEDTFRLLTGLTPNMTYSFCAIAENGNPSGKVFGAVKQFTTNAPAPIEVTTEDGTDLLSFSATLNGKANPNGAQTDGFFKYQATANPGSCGAAWESTSSMTDILDGTVQVDFSRSISGLAQGTTYYYCAFATNSGGTTDAQAAGDPTFIHSFVTPASSNDPPTVTGSIAPDPSNKPDRVFAFGDTYASMTGLDTSGGNLTVSAECEVTPGTVGVVQKATGNANGLNDVTATYPGATTSGNLLIALHGTRSQIAPTVPVGWSTAVQETQTSTRGSVLGIYYKIADGTEAVVTFNVVPAEDQALLIAEIEGTVASGVLGQTTSAAYSTIQNSFSTGTTPATTQANEIAIAGALIESSGPQADQSWTNDFYSFESTGISDIKISGGMRILNAVGTYETTESFTGTADEGSAAMATFNLETTCTGGGGGGGDPGGTFNSALAAEPQRWISHIDATAADIGVAEFVDAGGNCDNVAWDCVTAQVAADGSAIAIAPDGSVSMAYVTSSGALYIADYVVSGGSDCASTAWTCTIIDTDNFIGDEIDMAVGPDGKRWIVVEHTSLDQLNVIYEADSGEVGSCADNTAWECDKIVDSPFHVFGIAIDVFGDAWVAYGDSDGMTNSLYAAKYVGMGGTGCEDPEWNCERVFINLTFGHSHTMGIDIDPITNIPWIATPGSNTDPPAGDTDGFVVARRDGGGTGCNGGNAAWTCEVVATAVGANDAAIAIANDGTVWVAIHDTTALDLTVLRYEGDGSGNCAPGNQWTCWGVATSGSQGGNMAIAINTDGNPWVSFQDIINESLMLAVYVGPGNETEGCDDGDWECTVIDSAIATVAGYDSSIAISNQNDFEEHVWIAHYDDGADDLLASHYVGGKGNCDTFGDAGSDQWDCFRIDDIPVSTGDASYDISTATFTRIALSVATEEAGPRGMLFNDDGTKLYITGDTGDEINEYALSPAYDIFDATFTQIALSDLGMEGGPSSMLFNDDGTKLYVLGWDSEEVREYVLSAPYDINDMATFTQIALNVATEEGTPIAMIFNDDGTKLYVMGWDDDNIDEYALSPAYDINDMATFTGTALFVGGQETEPTGMIFNNDGTKLYVSGSIGDDINEYALSAPYDINSMATFTGVALDVSGHEAEPTAMIFNNDGTKLYVLGRDGDDIDEYALTPGGSRSTPALAIDAHGTPWIAYVDDVNDLYAAWYTGDGRGFGCAHTADWHCRLVNSEGDVDGNAIDMVFDNENNLWIAFYDRTTNGGELKVANHRYEFKDNTGSCAAATWNKLFSCVTVDSGAGVGVGVSIALNPTTGKPWVSYTDDANNQLLVAQRKDAGTGLGCDDSDWTCEQVHGAAGATSIDISPSGAVWVSFQTTSLDLGVANYAPGAGNASCSGAATDDWICETVDIGTNVGQYSSIVYSTEGNYPFMFFYNGDTGGIEMAFRGGSPGSCSHASWRWCTDFDSTGDRGLFPSVAFNGAGEYMAAYHDETNNDLLLIWDREGVGSGCSDNTSADCIQILSVGGGGAGHGASLDVRTTRVAAITQVQKISAGSVGDEPTVTATYPNTPKEGNTLIAIHAHDDANPATPPLGWATAAEFSSPGGTSRMGIYYKLAGASEATAVTFTIDNDDHQVLSIFEYQGIAESSPLDKTSVYSDGSANQEMEVTPKTEQADELIIVGAFKEAETTWDEGWAEAFIHQTEIVSTGGGSGDRIDMTTAHRIARARDNFNTENSTTANESGVGIIATFRAKTGSVPAGPRIESLDGFHSGNFNPAMYTVQKPAGVENDDILYATLSVDGGNSPMTPITISPPAGWTEVYHQQRPTDEGVSGLWYKVITDAASEPGTYDFTMAPVGDRGGGVMFRVSGADTSNPVSVSLLSTGNSTQPIAPSITTTVNDSLVLRVVNIDGGEEFHFPPSGHDALYDYYRNVSSDASGNADYYLQATAGATGTATYESGPSLDYWEAMTLAIAPAPNAFPVVDVQFGTSDSSGPPSDLSYPATGIDNGDLIVVVADAKIEPVPGSTTWPAGWTKLWDDNQRASAAYRIADGTENGGTFTLTFPGGTTFVETAAIGYVISNWHGTTPPEISGNSASLDVPSLDPTGWETEDTLWLAFGFMSFGRTNDDFTAPPTGYTNFLQESSSPGSAMVVATGRRELTAASEDPGSFGVTGDDGESALVAIRPIALGGGGDGNTIVFDNQKEEECAAGLTCTVSGFQLGSGGNRMVAVLTGRGEVTGVTFNSQAMTFVAQATSVPPMNPTSVATRVEMWAILEANLPAAGSYGVVVSYTASEQGSITVMSFEGVTQTIPSGAQVGTNSTNDAVNISTSVTSPANNSLFLSAVQNGGDVAGWAAPPIGTNGPFVRRTIIEYNSESFGATTNTYPYTNSLGAAISITESTQQRNAGATERLAIIAAAFAPAGSGGTDNGGSIRKDNTETVELTAGCPDVGLTCTLSNFTLGSGSDRMVLIATSNMQRANPITTLTFNGVDATNVATIENGTESITTELWAVLEASLPVAGDYDIVATWGANHTGPSMGVISYTGVQQVIPSGAQLDTATNINVTTISTTVTLPSDDSLVFSTTGHSNDWDPFGRTTGTLVYQNEWHIEPDSGYQIGTTTAFPQDNTSGQSVTVTEQCEHPTDCFRMAMVTAAFAPISANSSGGSGSANVDGIIESVTLDTRSPNGVSYNSFLWNGTRPAGSLVRMWLASSNCPNGETDPPDCTVPADPRIDEGFSGADNSPWPSQDWTTSTILGGVAEIEFNQGNFEHPAEHNSGARAISTMTPVADSEVLLRYRFGSNSGGSEMRICLRGSGGWDGSTWHPDSAYCFRHTNDDPSPRLLSYTAGAATEINLATMVSAAPAQMTWWSVRFRVESDDIQVKLWPSEEAEPAAWTREVSANSDVTGSGVLMLSFAEVTSSGDDAEELYMDAIQLRNVAVAPSADDTMTSQWRFYGENCAINGTPYTPAPGAVGDIGCESQHFNKRYFRYRVQLCEDTSCSLSGSTPTITNLSINRSF